MTTRIVYQQELKNLNGLVARMGNLLQVSIDETIHALQHMDEKLARTVIEKDDAIDKMEYNIETECINLIARQAPLAKDLRIIASYMRMIADIERIADHCADISEYILRMAQEGTIPMPDHVMEMTMQMKIMVKNTIDAFIHEDCKKASNVIAMDDLVDQYFEKIKDELAERMKINQDQIKQSVNYLMIIKYIERMADHSTNLARWIIYIHTGDLTL